MKCKMFPGGVEAWKAHVIMAVQPARWISAETHMEQIKAMILRSIAVDTSCWYHACWYQVCTKGMTTHSSIYLDVFKGLMDASHAYCDLLKWFLNFIPISSVMMKSLEAFLSPKQVKTLRWKLLCWVIAFTLMKPISQHDICQWSIAL